MVEVVILLGVNQGPSVGVGHHGGGGGGRCCSCSRRLVVVVVDVARGGGRGSQRVSMGVMR